MIFFIKTNLLVSECALKLDWLKGLQNTIQDQWQGQATPLFVTYFQPPGEALIDYAEGSILNAETATLNQCNPPPL
jgi:hypothetical protein